MWHSHMLDNKSYKYDTKKILGKVLNHRDQFEKDELKKYDQKSRDFKKKWLP